MAVATRIALLTVAAMAVLSTASAAIYNVGEPAGAWELGVDYGNWVSNKKFHPADVFVFKYSPQAHDVLRVSKADYDSCNTTNPSTTFKSGKDFIGLSSIGTRYYICGVPGHCAAGMKVKINIVAPSAPAPASGPSDTNSPPLPSPSAATSVGATGFGLAALLAVAGLMA